MLNGYPLAAPLLAPAQHHSNPKGNWSNANGLLSSYQSSQSLRQSLSR